MQDCLWLMLLVRGLYENSNQFQPTLHQTHKSAQGGTGKHKTITNYRLHCIDETVTEFINVGGNESIA